MLDRFQLFVILRNQVSDRAVVRRALAVEAVIEALAPAVDLDVEEARLAALGAAIDVQMCRLNPDRRGEIAAEFLATEGASAAVATAVRQCFREPRVDRLSALAALLVVAEALTDEIYAELAEISLDELQPCMAASPRARQCVERLGLDPHAAAVAALEAVRRVRDDLRL